MVTQDTMSKTSPARAKKTTGKAPSPRRRQSPGKPASMDKKATLTALAMHPAINLEIIIYSKGSDNDAFLNDIKNYFNGSVRSVDTLDEEHFKGCLVRKKLGTTDTILRDDKGFWRHVIVRHPVGGESTPETRARALEVLKASFLTKQFTQFPPDDIVTIDATDIDNLHSLDMYLLDRDIVNIINEQIDEADLNTDFYTTFQECACKLWSTTPYPNYARQTLGFPAP